MIKIQLVLEIGVTSTECFEALKKDTAVDLAIYTKENDLLELEGWKILANRSKLIELLVKQEKLHSLKFSPTYKYEYEVPNNYKDDERLDIKNGNYN